MWNASAPYSAYAPYFPSPLPAVDHPWYHTERAELVPGLSDKNLSLLAPVFVYWAFSLFFHYLDRLGWDALERYRIHEPEEVKSKNRVTVREVIVAVVLQHVVQTAAGWWFMPDDDAFVDHAADLNWWGGRIATAVLAVAGEKSGAPFMARYGVLATRMWYWYAIPVARLAWAMLVMDGWQYMMHRSAHQVTFLYRTIHSWHHRLYVPYAFGALYNHPIEGFVLDTLGTGIAHELSGLSIRQATLFFVASTMKTVDDHCGFAFPWDPLQHLFGNNADYHDIHHQVAGLKKNYSQPWFISWDIFFGTRMTRQEFATKVAKRFHPEETGEPVEVPKNEVNGPNELAAPPTSRIAGPALKEKVN
ncbi:hypothetical protein JCM8097_008775 [Rhodosporidiobolus ruineniae]